MCPTKKNIFLKLFEHLQDQTPLMMSKIECNFMDPTCGGFWDISLNGREGMRFWISLRGLIYFPKQSTSVDASFPISKDCFNFIYFTIISFILRQCDKFDGWYLGCKSWKSWTMDEDRVSWKRLIMKRKEKKPLDDMSIWKVIMVKDNLNGIWV
jgi:hypothetical protein